MSTSPRTRSAPSRVFWRSANRTIAVRSEARRLRGCEGAPQQNVGLGGFTVGFEKIAAFEHDRVELLVGYELDHVDLSATFLRQRLEIGVGENHRSFTVVVGAGDVFVIDNATTDLAATLIADTPAVGVVHLVQ
jgi:AMMECR1 domain-containing protein